MKRVYYIDPPSGWKYGFPKQLPEGTKDVHQFLVDNGYPKVEIDKLGEMFYTRHWYEDIDDKKGQ